MSTLTAPKQKVGQYSAGLKKHNKTISWKDFREQGVRSQKVRNEWKKEAISDD